jgi:hypothetical protein
MSHESKDFNLPQSENSIFLNSITIPGARLHYKMYINSRFNSTPIRRKNSGKMTRENLKDIFLMMKV